MGTGVQLKDLVLAVTRSNETVQEINGYELVFVNSDSGWREIKGVEVSASRHIVWLYEGGRYE
jgi:hypothetical protein